MQGLSNTGNNCYVNAIVQAMRYCKPIVTKLVDASPDNEFAAYLCDLLYQGNEHGLSYMLNEMHSIGMDPHTPSDAHEFYLEVVNKLDKWLDHGNTESTLQCSCGYSTTSTEKFWSISINGDVAEGIDHYEKPEHVEATCEKCGGIGMTKSLKILPSPMLVVHLKRFDMDGKLNYKTTIPPALRGHKLTAVCNHYGSMNGGHYTTCALTDQGWMSFNDETVTKIDTFPPTSSLPYILFYTSY